MVGQMKIAPSVALFCAGFYVVSSKKIISAPAHFLISHFDDFNVILITQPRLTVIPLALATQTIEDAWRLIIPIEIRENLHRLRKERSKFRTSIFVFIVFPS